MIQDEISLLEEIDYRLMERIYEWQAMAADPELMPDYRAHYKKRLEYVREELDAILGELNRAK